jgi:membrane-bound lytic murein transglycosylase A
MPPAARVACCLLAFAILYGCASHPPKQNQTTIAPPPATIAPSLPKEELAARPSPFKDLPGWSAENHAAALVAFAAGCGATHDLAMAIICHDARRQGPLDESAARAFFEENFRPEAVGPPGLLTAYFTPVYEAADAPGGEFTAPVRPRPVDLPQSDAVRGGGAPYADRATIEARGARTALAWMRPEDLFFLQIQGSGVLFFPDGSRKKAVFDGSNGAPFVGIAAPMRRQGLLEDNNTSAETIRLWLAGHHGRVANAIMDLDPRYVFFRLASDDGALPAGAAGVTLIAGRSLAIDPDFHELGELLWIDASSPALTGAFPSYQRLAMALDTGGAIKGEARADLYLGRGAAAGLEAGRVRHVLRLYRFTPVVRDGS